MNLIESFKIALDSIRVNKLRSTLTMLGIIIGVGSVIAMTSLGNGLSNLVASEINANGSNLLYVSGTTDSGFPSLTLEDAMVLTDSVSDVSQIASITTINSDIDSAAARQLTGVSAISDNYLTLTNADTFASGQFWDDDSEQVAVLGQTIADSLFPDSNALDNVITIEGVEFTVVGVLEVDEENTTAGPPLPPGAPESARRSFFTPDEATMIYVPFAIAQETLPLPTTETDNLALTTIVVAATESTVVERVTEQVTSILRDAHSIANNAEDDFTLISQAALADTFSTITGSLTLFLGAIAGISLIVGGIGIMNIMLVSVTERTHEIGIRKALGALKRDILSQFMIESLVLSLLGGLIGLLLGWGIAIIGGTTMGLTASLSISMVMIALGFSTTVGLIFGIYPAWKAAQLTPIIALRYE